MDAETFLKQYANAKIKLGILEQELDIVVEDMIPVKSTSDLDGMPRGTQKSDPTSEIVIRIQEELVDRRLKIAEQRLEAVKKREAVFNAIMLLEGTEQAALYAKYILLYDEVSICNYIKYEKTQTHEYINRGIKSIQALIDCGKLRTKPN